MLRNEKVKKKTLFFLGYRGTPEDPTDSALVPLVLCVCVILSFFSTKDTQTQEEEEEEEDEQLLSTRFSSRKSLSTVVI